MQLAKRACPSCGHPAIGFWRLHTLGGLRRATCPACGVRIGLSRASAFALLAVGTWFPVASAVICAALAARISPGHLLLGGALGLALGGCFFGLAFFRSAKLVH